MKTNKLVTARNKVTSVAQATYRSNKSILLDMDFKAEPTTGGYFKSKFGGCDCFFYQNNFVAGFLNRNPAFLLKIAFTSNLSSQNCIIIKKQVSTMKTYFIILLTAIILACKVDDNSNVTSPIIAANAILHNNNLPVDGCEKHISLLDSKGEKIKVLLPTEATKPLFTNMMNAEIAKLPKDTYSGNLNIPVVLKYKETQQKVELLCGWNKKLMAEQIEIIAILKK